VWINVRKVKRTVRSPRRTTKRRVPRLFTRSLFPSTRSAAFVYADQQSLASVSGALTTYTYRLNSLYDPDFTGSGGQPLYYDTLLGASGGVQPYNSYRVHGAKITVTFMNPSSSSGSLGYVILRARPSTQPSWGVADAADDFILPWTKYKLIHINGNSHCIKKMSMYVPIKKLASLKDLSDDPAYAASWSSNPAQVIMADLSYAPIDQSSTATIRYTVKITYYSQLFTQNMVADS